VRLLREGRACAPARAVDRERSAEVRLLSREEIPSPPFWGARVVARVDLAEVFPYVNRTALFKNQWQLRGLSKPEYNTLVAEKYEPVLHELQREALRHGYLQPRVAYGYFPCNSEGNDLLVFDPADFDREVFRFHFPRQDKGRRLCLADFFAPVGAGFRDVIGLQVVTVGDEATRRAQELYASDEYTRYLYVHGLGVETAEALAEYWHRRLRQELGIAGQDSADVEGLFHQGYQGSRYSFGYGACPDLEEQKKIFQVVPAGEIGVHLTETWQLEPEQSTTALVVHHPQARYFNV
jgi:5-methyltetrahydrofolate--homocysteine methyltransferase